MRREARQAVAVADIQAYALRSRFWSANHLALRGASSSDGAFSIQLPTKAIPISDPDRLLDVRASSSVSGPHCPTSNHLLDRVGFVVEQVYADFERTPFGSKYPGELIFVSRKSA